MKANTYMRLAHHNLNRGNLAMHEFRHMAVLEKVDIAGLQEPPTMREKVPGLAPFDRLISVPGERTVVWIPQSWCKK